MWSLFVHGIIVTATLAARESSWIPQALGLFQESRSMLAMLFATLDTASAETT